MLEAGIVERHIYIYLYWLAPLFTSRTSENGSKMSGHLRLCSLNSSIGTYNTLKFWEKVVLLVVMKMQKK